ncbi:ABC transporter permease [Streptomyces hoynatensis]|uniref:ABC transporter permease n=1 Tax=Streptomyces hoynatensis TaxID=1141874 RepID=A0A3A9YXJ9_9ACTN|nr:ABC transporter permease [Streptomyces hoynatensis]RKN40374.1 ABC transporter permease [Streptomyces hoynatensis]
MTLTIAAISLRETSRRRVALLFVFLLPLVFYLVRLDVHWQAIRFLAIGVGWAIATLSLFSHVGARRLGERLSVIGASPTSLFLGRQLALVGAGLALACAYFALVAATLDVPRLPAVALLLGTTVLVAAPLGALVSLVLPRELEGALALLSLMALQLLADPADAFAKALPMWSTRELAAYAIEPVGAGPLRQGLLHFAGTLVLCSLIAWGANRLRLRPVRLPEPAPEPATR